MESLFTNKTSVDEEKNIEFHKVNFFNNTLRMLILYEIALFVFLILAIFLKSLILIIALGILILLFALLAYLFFIFGEKKVKKKYKNEIKNLDFSYDFLQDKIKITLDFNGAINDTEISYQYVSKVLITSSDYYLFITNNSCYIVNKNGFNNLDDFNEDEFLKLFNKAKIKNVKG